MLHVNPELESRGLALVFNPTGRTIYLELELPLHYVGLKGEAVVSERGGAPRVFELDVDHAIRVPIDVDPDGFTWLVVRAP